MRRLSAAQVHGVLARMSFMVGNRELAERELSEAARLDPSELNALVVRHELMGNEAASGRLEIARRAVLAHPGSAAAWLLLAKSAADQRQKAAALARASELAPDHPSVRAMLAEERFANGDPKAALAHSRIALRRSARSVPVLAMHVQILAANQRCGDAERLQHNLEGMLNDSCSSTEHSERCLQVLDRARKVWGSTPCAR